MASNGTAPAPAQAGVIDQNDVNDWVKRFNEALADSTTVTAPAAQDARPWHSSFFGCFAPIDTCFITCCVPCVTFGKTHHRSRKHGNMEGYNFINASCLMFTGFSCFGLHFIPMMFQRADIRKKYNLQGDCVGDLLTSCCCGCCSLIQQDKEAEFREKELAEKVNGAGYTKPQDMAYPA
ncbi:uncharacterized protein A1O5_04551 [Cladophialophora psammophila CBS 110553]|uniref:Uncharacterized protein n=1 Tax=Cladophialophora psammophila CBS 110553 TaxID=1182543 RepID=W9WVS6_9EURO|nr:uncharacterized protein A1O5_04551 [Cladophialophora psammophila CBS 110553]EXJ72048.1 hypothetical protein A1O5_04551 [Cladophialophora psammophila CBS 110553]